MNNRCKLMFGDCLVEMEDIPDGSIDMIFADLPYGVTANKKDAVIPFDKLWEQYLRIAKENTCIALFAQGLFYVDLVNSQRKLYKYDIIWDKILVSGFLNAKKMPMRKHEQLAIFYKKQPIYNPQMTQGKPQHAKGNNSGEIADGNRNLRKYLHDDRKNGSTEKYPTSIFTEEIIIPDETVLTFQKPHPSKALHRTEKSISFCENIIKTYTDEDMVVLDNTMGSGTSGVACKNTNRIFIGIENDQKYFDIARNRICE